MKYMGDQNYWDEKFENRENRLMSPEKELVDAISSLKAGTVLDIACGDGRNSIFLLSEGFDVTSVDFSGEALKRLTYFGKKKGHEPKTMQRYLSEPSWLKTIGIFDNIIICHYRLAQEQLKKMHEHIRTNGILFVTGFGHEHIPDERIGEGDRLLPEDFSPLDLHFDRLSYREFSDDRGAFVTYIFRRK